MTTDNSVRALLSCLILAVLLSIQASAQAPATPVGKSLKANGAAIGGLAENAAAQQTRAQLASQVNNAQAAALEQKARNYRRAMSACLEGRGYNVR